MSWYFGVLWSLVFRAINQKAQDDWCMAAKIPLPAPKAASKRAQDDWCMVAKIPIPAPKAASKRQNLGVYIPSPVASLSCPCFLLLTNQAVLHCHWHSGTYVSIWRTLALWKSNEISCEVSHQNESNNCGQCHVRLYVYKLLFIPKLKEWWEALGNCSVCWLSVVENMCLQHFFCTPFIGSVSTVEMLQSSWFSFFLRRRLFCL